MTVKFKSNGIRYALLVASNSMLQDERRVARILRPERARGPQEITINYESDRCVRLAHQHRPKRSIRILKATHAKRSRHRA